MVTGALWGTAPLPMLDGGESSETDDEDEDWAVMRLKGAKGGGVHAAGVERASGGDYGCVSI